MDNVVINITEIQDNVQITLNECITEVATDGITITGNGTSNPLSAVVGSGDMMRATYDPTNKNADAFSMENMVEGATKKILTSAERTKLNNLSGTNTGDQDLTPYLTSATAAATYQPIGSYLTSISGLNISQLTNDSGYMMRATYDPTNKNADAFSMENMVEGATKKILTSAERTKLNNLSGTNTGDQDLTPYLTSATAAATYQPIGSYLTSISGLNISQLTNDSGFITSAALSPYQPILVSGTTIKTINGTSLLGAGDITISAAAALSSITAATSSNIINNGNFTQEWQWDSLTNGTGFKLSSNSTLASSNSQSIFEISNSGANATSIQTTYGAKIANTKTGTSSTNYGLAITATGATTNLPLLANGVAEIARFDGTTNPYLTFYKNGVLKSYLGQYNSVDDNLRIQTASTNSIYMGTNNATQVVIENNRLGINSNPSCPLDVTGTAVSGRIAKFSGGGVEIITTNDAAFFHQRANVFGTFGVNSSGNFIIGCNGLGTGTQIAIHSTRNNVGIGTITPNESAKLDVSSTTQGFAPPEMTATQASAISTTSRKLIIYVTDTNGTFTSAGLWMWTGTLWKLILAQ